MKCSKQTMMVTQLRIFKKLLNCIFLRVSCRAYELHLNKAITIKQEYRQSYRGSKEGYRISGLDGLKEHKTD